MKNQKVCIVGNGTSILNQNKGKSIDKFDIVVRFNRSPTEGYEEHVGTKTTHRFVNRVVSKNNREDSNEDINFIPSLKNQIIILDGENNINNVSFYKKIFHESCKYKFINRNKEVKKLLSQNLPHIKFNGKNPTGGLAMISHFINEQYNVTICGFDLENNLNKKIIPHFFEKKRVKTSHDYEYEVKIINELIDKKIIKKL